MALIVVTEPLKREAQAWIVIGIFQTYLDEGESFKTGAWLGLNKNYDLII